MIHFDTDCLIALPVWSRDGHAVIDRVVAGEPAGVCAVVWYELLIGPIPPGEVKLAHAFVRGRVVPIDAEDSALAADLFNHAGRRPTLKTDALIAACAIRAGADFCTLNRQDFEPFVALGLRLLPAN